MAVWSLSLRSATLLTSPQARAPPRARKRAQRDPNQAIAAISKGEAFHGDVDILGKPYTTGYEPIRDSAKTVIGIYYVGYLK